MNGVKQRLSRKSKRVEAAQRLRKVKVDSPDTPSHQPTALSKDSVFYVFIANAKGKNEQWNLFKCLD